MIIGSSRKKRFIFRLGIFIVGLPFLIYGALLLNRPAQSFKQEQLFKGIVYQRIPKTTPRNIMLHIVTVNLKEPSLKFFVTPSTQKKPDDMEIEAETTSSFLLKHKLQVAINGSFFYPFYEKNPFDYYPHSGERVNIVGEAISQGKKYSQAQSGWSMLCISPQQEVSFEPFSCPTNTLHALSGKQISLEEGKPAKQKDRNQDQQLFPITAVAMDKNREKLWFIIIDGRQPFYSEGATITDLSDIVIELGADQALLLDGGGSTTLVMGKGEKARLLNSPIHTRIPGRQRPVANNLGIFALPSD